MELFIWTRNWVRDDKLLEPKPTLTISLETLLDILQRESAVLAPEDAPGLAMVILRYATESDKDHSLAKKEWIKLCEDTAEQYEEAGEMEDVVAEPMPRLPIPVSALEGEVYLEQVAATLHPTDAVGLLLQGVTIQPFNQGYQMRIARLIAPFPIRRRFIERAINTEIDLYLREAQLALRGVRLHRDGQVLSVTAAEMMLTEFDDAVGWSVRKIEPWLGVMGAQDYV